MMSDKYAEAGQKIFCAGCGDHIATVARFHDFFSQITDSSFEPGAGQGPWMGDEPLECRKCKQPFSIFDKWFTDNTNFDSLNRER